MFMKIIIPTFLFIFFGSIPSSFCQTYSRNPKSFYNLKLIIESNGQYEISRIDSLLSGGDILTDFLYSKGKVIIKDSTLILIESGWRKRFYLKKLSKDKLIVVKLPYFNKNDTLIVE